MSARSSLSVRWALGDLRGNVGTSAALVLVLVLILSALLMATGAMVMERLLGSIDSLFEQSQPPHFLQMHKGDYDTGALERFATDHPEIDAWLVEEMLGYDSAALYWHRPSTGESGDLSASATDICSSRRTRSSTSCWTPPAAHRNRRPGRSTCRSSTSSPTTCSGMMC